MFILLNLGNIHKDSAFLCFYQTSFSISNRVFEFRNSEFPYNYVSWLINLFENQNKVFNFL